jgi:predicted transcriptional regulator
MGKYRSRLQIVADILWVVSRNDSVKKTKIMYLANLSWKFLNRYLDELVEAGLISFGSSDCYVVTAKGKLFLERFSEYSKRREMVEGYLSDLEKEKRLLENMFLMPGEDEKQFDS